jgi:hypothetical protein
MPNVQNREFVYRAANVFEHLPEFTQRVQQKFPYAELLTYTHPPPESVRNSDGQCIPPP